MEFEWYPGHMEKARRNIVEDLKLVDLVIEIIDARIPYSSSNPTLNELTKNKKKLIVMSKIDLADEKVTNEWIEYYKKSDIAYLPINALKKDAKKLIVNAAKEACKEKIERDKRRGLRNRKIKAMIIGIPNVGKSTLINTLSGKASAKTGNKPGVTRGKQWIHASNEIDFLDTPGVLWPKFDRHEIGENLAITGAIRNELIPFEELAEILIEKLKSNYPGLIEKRYSISEDLSAREMYEAIATNRGYLMSQGVCDTKKAAEILIQDYRTGKFGRVSLELPSDYIEDSE
ncbi:MAG: ribosome biogenesis GTPase YlqF [Lachnospiraceae bacterium]|nr:ribosome biogenesis GTPase YlqF [Lachnospiraceae bacterium]